MPTGYVGPNGQWIEVTDTPNQSATSPSALYVQRTTSGVVLARPGVLISAVVVVALGTGAVTIYDNASAASGNVLAVIPASAAVGTVVDFGGGAGVEARAGIFADFASTGTVNFLFQ